MKTFILPDLGEGLPDAEIVEWHVKEGDFIKLDAPLVSMETAKAVVDVPSPYTGTVVKLFGAAGDVIAPLHWFRQREECFRGVECARDHCAIEPMIADDGEPGRGVAIAHGLGEALRIGAARLQRKRRQTHRRHARAALGLAQCLNGAFTIRD